MIFRPKCLLAIDDLWLKIRSRGPESRAGHCSRRTAYAIFDSSYFANSTCHRRTTIPHKCKLIPKHDPHPRLHTQGVSAESTTASAFSLLALWRYYKHARNCRSSWTLTWPLTTIYSLPSLNASLNFPPAFKISTSFAYKGSWVHWLEISPIRIISCLAVSPARPKRITISEIGAEVGATFYDDGSKFVLVH